MAEAIGPESGERGIRPFLLPLGIVLVGLLVLLYPVVSTQINNVRQHKAAEEYVQETLQHGPDERRLELERAEEYNATHPKGPILDPWLARVSEDNADFRDYREQLDLTDVMSNLRIPSINVNLPVRHGTGEDVLSTGIGHLYGSSLPVGGAGTHAVLTGHTGLSTATLFDNLVKVGRGDALYVETLGRRMKYEVSDIKVVLPNEPEGLEPVANEDLLTLITCTPYGQNTHRLLVTGHRVPLDPEEADGVFGGGGLGLQWQWWMIAVLVGVVAVAAGMGYWLWRTTRGDIADVDGDGSDGDGPDGDGPDGDGPDGAAGGAGAVNDAGVPGDGYLDDDFGPPGGDGYGGDRGYGHGGDDYGGYGDGRFGNPDDGRRGGDGGERRDW